MIVNEDHFRYLFLQRGEIANAYADGGFKQWKMSFEASLDSLMGKLAPALPTDAREILDVGGGLGALGVLLSRRYPSAGYWILDGVRDPPELRRHAKTFSNAEVSADFLRANGLKKFGHYAPDVPRFDRQFDLVVSTASWCFHIPPEEYLERVQKAPAPNATVVLEVRRESWKWIERLQKALGNPVMHDIGKKHVRLVWRT